jgi:hypothetical protein
MIILLLHFHLLLHFMAEKDAVFSPQTIDDKVAIGYGLAIGDVDGDRKPDILLADKKQFVWYRNGDWKRFVMIDSLTISDNVCIAARDLNGDGKVEVAVGAQWNPGETSDTTRSGSVHYLISPSDRTQRWKAVQLHHEPTIHRMKWVRAADKKYYLVVVPLHGRGNKNGEGEGVKVLAYEFPANVNHPWRTFLLDNNMHLTHNFDISEFSDGKKTEILLAGKEGVRLIREPFNISDKSADSFAISGNPAGEIRKGKLAGNTSFLAIIEPMHGNQLSVFPGSGGTGKIVLDDNLKEGHALGVADFNRSGSDQIVMGWRLPNKDNKVGIKIYAAKDATAKQWQSRWVDENGMACEDLQVMDLNADGKPEIIASGRATHNLVIYWNK